MATLQWLVSRRESGFVSRDVYFRATRDSPYLVRRLAKSRVLEGHNGCVNSVSWNDTGTRLISGSDDCHLNIYDTATGLLHHSLHSTHQSNIFSAKFLPETGDYKAVSCAGIGSVEVSELTPYGEYIGHAYKCQTSITYQVAVTPNNPHEFFTCEEGGLVRLYDLRQTSSCACDGCQRDLLYRFPAAVTSMAIHPVYPHYMVVALGDGTLRLLDRRKAGSWREADPVSSLNPLMLGVSCSMMKYCPSSLKHRKLKITSVNFNLDGSQLLASYSEDYVYLFNSGLFGGPNMSTTPNEIRRPQYLSQCECFPGARRRVVVKRKPNFGRSRSNSDERVADSSQNMGESFEPSSSAEATASGSGGGGGGGGGGTTEKAPARKRLRLRGDWSDTGPEARPESQSESSSRGNLMNRMSMLFARWVDMSLDRIGDQSGEEDREREEGGREQRRNEDSDSHMLSSPDGSFHLFSDSDSEREMEQENQEDTTPPPPLLSPPPAHDNDYTSTVTTSLASAFEGLPYTHSPPSSVASENTAQVKEEGAGTSVLLSVAESSSNRDGCGLPCELESQVLSAPSGKVGLGNNSSPVSAPELSVAGGKEVRRDLDCVCEKEKERGEEEEEKEEEGGEAMEEEEGKERKEEEKEVREEEEDKEREKEKDAERHRATNATPELSSSGERTAISDSLPSGVARSYSQPLRAEVREHPTPGFLTVTIAGEGEPEGAAQRSHDRSCDHSYRRSRFRVHRGREDEQRERSEGEESGIAESEAVEDDEQEEKEEDEEEEGAVDQMVPDVMRAVRSVETYVQPFMVYRGHRNARTMIKQANFWGDNWVLSGSDCGRVFVWDKWSGEVVNLLTADSHVVNCVQPHPSAYMIATSGIDYNIKLWEPVATEETSLANLEEVIRRNEEMLQESRNTITIPSAFLLRILAYLNRGRRMRREPSVHNDSD